MEFEESLKDIYEDIKKAIHHSLKNEVSEKVKELEMKHIQDDVYDAYNPSVYKRRGDYDGLGDEDNIVSSVTGDELTVSNETIGNQWIDGTDGGGEDSERFENLSKNDNKSIINIIESGLGYDTKFSMPRPFLQNTKEEILTTNQIEDALGSGLKRNGYEFK